MQRHLQNTGRGNCAAALAEMLAVDVLVSNEENRMIQHVESFCPERKFHFLGHLKLLLCGKIPIEIGGSGEGIELQVADFSGLRIAETALDGWHTGLRVRCRSASTVRTNKDWINSVNGSVRIYEHAEVTANLLMCERGDRGVPR